MVATCVSPASPCSPYLGPDLDSPPMPMSTPFSECTFVITPGKNDNGRKRVSMVGPYKLGRTLGKGSCGVVKLGTHMQTGEKVAVKVLKPKNDRERNEIQREIDALQNLDHPHIIRLIEVINGADLRASPTSPDMWSSKQEYQGPGLDKYIFMVLELATGGELFEKVLQGGPLSEHEARTHMRDIISAISNSHAHLICHRDLKPENILFDSKGKVKISDFGLSNVSKPGKLLSTWCGSPMYAPPEVVMEQKYRGSAVDVWSLGIILYVMVTGGMPWRLERGQVRDLELFLSGVYAVPNDMGISENCKDMIDRMIQSNPINRACMRELATHPWITNDGALPPPDICLQVPRNAKSLLTPQALTTEPRYIVDEEILFQVQETIGLDRRGMLESRAAIQKLQACPALTAYCKLAAIKNPPAMLVSNEMLPVYMRHRRNRSEVPRPNPGLVQSLLPLPAAAPASPFPTIAQFHNEGTTLILGGGQLNASTDSCGSDNSRCPDGATPTSPLPSPPSIHASTAPARSRALTSPAAYKPDERVEEVREKDISPSQPKSRREVKQGASRHVFRTLLLKLKWGKK